MSGVMFMLLRQGTSWPTYASRKGDRIIYMYSTPTCIDRAAKTTRRRGAYVHSPYNAPANHPSTLFHLHLLQRNKIVSPASSDETLRVALHILFRRQRGLTVVPSQPILTDGVYRSTGERGLWTYSIVTTFDDGSELFSEVSHVRPDVIQQDLLLLS